MENFIDYAKRREEEFTKVKQEENDIMTYVALREYYNDWVKLNMHVVVSSNLIMQIVDFDSNEILISTKQILPFSKESKLTIKDKYYEVDYIDFDFDKGIFEVVVNEV